MLGLRAAMLDKQFRKQRDLAARADPFIKRRLLDLSARYEGPERDPTRVTPLDLPIKSRDNQLTER